MPIFEVQGPDGAIYEIDAPDEAQAVGAFQQFIGGEAEQPKERTLRQRLYDNIIGDPNDGVQSTGEALGTWLNRAGESATLGVVGDEASAAVYAPIKRTLGSDATYESELKRFRQNEEDMSTLARLSADITGAVVPGLLGVGIVSGGSTLGAQALRGAGVGIGSGGLYGFMEGEGDERVGDAVAGGVIGGILGGATPALANLAGRGYRGAKEYARNTKIGKSVGDALGVDRKTGGLLADLVGMQDPARMSQALARSGDDAMLADAGPSLRDALDTITQTPGEGARTALSRIDDRASKAGYAIQDALDPQVGPKQPVGSLMEQIRKGSAGTRSAAYDAAYSKPIDYSSQQGARLLDKVTPRLPKEAISYANRLMKVRGETSRQIMADISEDGTVTFTNPPDVRQWDYIKQALDGLAESGDGAGALGGQTRMGSAYQGLAREIRDGVAELVPEYRVALDTAADAIGQRNAVKFGAELLSPRITTEEALDQIGNATKAEANAMRDGVRGQIEEVIGNVKAVATDQNIDAREAMTAFKNLSSRNTQRKMEALFGDDWKAIKKTLDEAGQALGLRATVGGNSRTAGREAFKELLNSGTEPGAFRKGEPIGTARTLFQRLTGATPDRVAAVRGDIQQELADVLTRPDAQGLLNMIETARASNRLPANIEALPRAIANTGLLGMIPQVSSGLSGLLGR